MSSHNLAALTEEELLHLIQIDDNRAAFSEIYHRYWKILLDITYQRVKSIDIAEEIVQDLFVSFFLRRKEITLQSNLEAYFKTAIKYKVFKLFRNQKAKASHDQAIRENFSEPAAPDTLLETKELRQKILTAAEKMPDKCREVFLLSRFEQLSNAEIAERLNISVSTVKKHLTKGIAIMRTELGNPPPELLAICFFLYLSL